MKIVKFLMGCLVVAGLSMLSFGAYAQNTTQGTGPGVKPGVKPGIHKNWRREHPRRAQVNRRLDREHRRIYQGVEKGTLTKPEAMRLHKEDRQIRHEERDMAAQNGGHITGSEQKVLNQQENGVSRQIYRDEHSGNSTH